MEKFLINLDSSDSIKNFNNQGLYNLAHHIRKKIIQVVSENGGHLASSLGAVELCIALHYVFNLEKQDVVVWDVGHQAYAHKLLTGRAKKFHTLRQFGGISGFPSKFESKYDPFIVGHGSTAISSALGIITAKELSKEIGEVIAVVGDGSLQGGMAFEALNHVAQLDKKIIVILNDNEMSISPTVGAMSKYLNRIITNPIYNRIKDDIENLFRRIPRLGEPALKAVRRLEGTLKNLLVPGIIFEELGYIYLGPIDGHDMNSLIDILKGAKQLNDPVLIHVITKKGKGYKFAEAEPSSFHSAEPFDIKTGKSIVSSAKGDERSFTKVFTEKMINLSKNNKKIVGITAAMPGGSGLAEFGKKFPHRFFDVGMAEQHAITFAAGLASKNYIPVAAIYSTFLQRAYDQIVHDVCLQNLHVVFALDRAGIVGEDGPTHQGVFDLAYLRHLPNMTVLAPKSPDELAQMLEFSIDFGRPIAIRYPKGAPLWYDKNFSQFDKKNKLTYSKAEVMLEGKDVAIIALGSMVYPALIAATNLQNVGITTTVVNARFIKPLDEKMLDNIFNQYRFILTVEEGCLSGGFGSAVLEYADIKNENVKLVRLGIPDRFIEHGDRQLLLGNLGLSPEGIFKKIKELCQT